AHDLNNILGPIVAYPELILESMAGDDPRREEVARIGKSANRAMVIIQDLLALARRGGYQTEPVHLNELVRLCEMSTEFKEQLAIYPDVGVATHLEADLPHIVGSTPHLMQVIMNLLHNAFEAMPHGGRVSISTTCEFVDAHEGMHDSVPEGDYVVLRVGDQGVGMTPYEMEHL
ncbi:MAG: hypothetical protein GWO44_15475, partial [Thermoplasmata archaeon]|nr:hypothetical protein [Thermoplasmata archaeon]NIY04607.1 hypothetical protein [Thermoplasmata archaeon]